MKKFLDRLSYERALQCLVVLNLIDGISTHIALKRGLMQEANPLMRWAYMVSPELFWIVKMVLVVGGILIIGKHASAAVARSAVLSANAIYLFVIGLHIYGWVSYFHSL